MRRSANRSAHAKGNAIASTVTSIRRLVRALRVNAQRTQAVAGISAAQLFVLQQLGVGEGLSLNELAARTLTDRSSVADVVDRLLANGLVRRTVDESDRRRASIHITPAGRRVLKRAPAAPTTALIAALRKLSPTEQGTLARSLRRLNDALGAGTTPATMLFADADDTAVRRPARKQPKRP
jgi:DNA-binding MarR family transcriptional regulator